jgi:hypothetical protein
MMNEIETTAANEQKKYRDISKLVDNWLELHKDEEFDLDIICRHLQINERENRNLVTIKLAREVKQGKLEKSKRLYRYIDNNINYINWWEIKDPDQYVNINFPSNHQAKDLSYFSLQDIVRMSAASVGVIAGETNAGKSVWARNLVWDNMDIHHVRYLVSQTSAAAFARYARNMTWANPMKDHNTPKFEVIERYEDFQDLILPDAFNIVDWLDADKIDYYKIGALIKAMQVKLRNGLLWVMIQKNSGTDWGDGGIKSAKWADVYLTISHNKEKNFTRLNVQKAKEWIGNHDPNGKVYGFEIVNYGSQLANIREVKRCPKCWGSGRDKQNNECYNCAGIGYLDVSRVIKKSEPEALPF